MMRTVTPKVSFTAYPGNKRTEFIAGVSISVSPDFATMLLSKGLIERPTTKKLETAPDADE